MAHSTARRGCRASDKSRHGLFHMLLYVSACVLFSIATDLANHDDGFGIRIFIKKLYSVGVVRTIDGITTNANASGLSIAKAGNLPDCFVSQRSGTGNYSDRARLVDVARHDAYLAFAWRNNARTVRTD